MKKLSMIIAVAILLFCVGSTTVLASAPATKQQAIKVANDEIRTIIEYNYFEDKNVTGKAIEWIKTTRLSGVSAGGLTGMGSLIYGGPHGDTKDGVNRYLGCTYFDEDYTNPDFPHDAWGGGYLEDRQWIKEPWYKVRRQHQNTFDTNVRYLPNIQMGIALYYGESSKGGNSKYWNTWHNYMHILVPPTQYTWGMGRMWHNLNGSMWYITVPLTPGCLVTPPDLSTNLAADKFTDVKPGEKVTSTVTYKLNSDHNRSEQANLRLHHVVGGVEYPVAMTPMNGAPDPNSAVTFQPGQEVTYQYTFTVQSAGSTILARINPANSALPDKNWSNNRDEALVIPQAVDIKVGINADNEYFSDGSGSLSYEVAITRKDTMTNNLPVKLTIYDKKGTTVKEFAMTADKKKWNTWMMWDNVKPGTYTIEAQAWPTEGKDIYPADNTARKTITVKSQSFNVDNKIWTETTDIGW